MSGEVWIEYRRRLRRPLIYGTLWPGCGGVVIYIAMNQTTSNGAGMWWPAVILPAGIGLLWVVAGVTWIVTPLAELETSRCGACGYDLRRQESVNGACPECGECHPTTQPTATVRGLARAPGAVILFGATCAFGLAAFMFAMINAGVFDI